MSIQKRTKISQILGADKKEYQTTVMGWVRTFRNNQFIALNDGSTLKTLQVVVDREKLDESILKRITTGAAISATGTVVESQGRGQTVELVADSVKIYGDSDPDKYPLQPKKHSLEFLREIAHLRFRTNTFGAVFRLRHAIAFSIHKFFNDRGYFYIHSPIITGSDAEGAGEMFQVTTMEHEDVKKTENGEVDYKADFFGKKTHLTVSGQLQAELAALSLSQVYTFGPTFRAENSNTSRHLAEFWMIEPEVAFADIDDNMDLAEDMLKYVINYCMDNFKEDIEFLQQRLENEEKQKPQNERSPMPLMEKLQFCVSQEFERLTYTEAIHILKNSKPNKKGKFQFPIEGFGADLQSEHERYLVEKHFKKPVILTGYPKEIKAFYMRMNEDDKTVAAMDILFPGIPVEEMEWFLDTRRFGSVPHAGFGLGFERLVMFITGMGNIRDVIPFPRYPGSAEF